MTEISSVNLSAAYGDHYVIRDLTIAIPKSKITALVGANGSGKSTFLRTIARILTPAGGAVYLDGASIHNTPTRAVARKLAMLPQSPDAPGGLTVYELVSCGRYPHQGVFAGLTKTDREKIDAALAATEMDGFAGRPLAELSGGQRQRAWIAMALAQDTPLLLLDEPTTFLDMAHQIDILRLIRSLQERDARTIIMVLHDLNIAARFSDHMIAIKKGSVAASGRPVDVMTTEMLMDVFDVDAEILREPRTGLPFCVVYESRRGAPVS